MNTELQNRLSKYNIKEFKPVSGGDVNDAYKLETDEEPLFLLVQEGADASFYDSEVAGLKAFEEVGITAPRVLEYGTAGDDAFLLLSYLDEGHSGSQKELGHLVAKLHETVNPEGKFGFETPHRGSDITFSNSWTEDWKTQFIDGRMDVLMERLVKDNKWDEDDKSKYLKAREMMVKTLESHHSEPSLLHGDLWAGNYMFLKDGTPALFDPSPFYGDREFDLGATLVFGGFDKDFYDAYNTHYKLDGDAFYRINFYKLYLLMVHLMKFGSVYYNSVNQTLNDIIDI